MNIGPDCTATIVVNGKEHRCNRQTGDPHFSNECMHETIIEDEGGQSGTIVRWGTWRMVTPAKM